MPRGGHDPRADVGRLYDRYGASLYRYALMMLADPAGAEDVIQQVFVALLSQRRRIEHDERYLRRAVRNECFSALRRRVHRAGRVRSSSRLGPTHGPTNGWPSKRRCGNFPRTNVRSCTCTCTRG